MSTYSIDTSMIREGTPQRQSATTVLVASGALWALIRYAEAWQGGITTLPEGTDHEDLLIARHRAQSRLSRAVLYSMQPTANALLPAGQSRAPRTHQDVSTLTADQESNLQEARFAQRQMHAARASLAQQPPFTYQHEMVLRAALVYTATHPDTDWRVREARMVAAARGYHDLIMLPVFAAPEPARESLLPAFHADCTLDSLVQ